MYCVVSKGLLVNNMCITVDGVGVRCCFMGQIASLRRRGNDTPNVSNAVDDDDEKCEMRRFSNHPGEPYHSTSSPCAA